jgi:hypothetical protein
MCRTLHGDSRVCSFYLIVMTLTSAGAGPVGRRRRRQVHGRRHSGRARARTRTRPRRRIAVRRARAPATCKPACRELANARTPAFVLEQATHPKVCEQAAFADQQYVGRSSITAMCYPGWLQEPWGCRTARIRYTGRAIERTSQMRLVALQRAHDRNHSGRDHPGAQRTQPPSPAGRTWGRVTSTVPANAYGSSPATSSMSRWSSRPIACGSAGANHGSKDSALM